LSKKKRRGKMNSFKTWFVRVTVSLFLVAMVSGCGIFSVSWIRNASHNEIVNLGDSIFALSGKIHDDLQSMSGTTFRRYSKSGATITGGDSITPDLNMQYASAKSDHSYIKTIFMDGGGNEILIPSILFDPYHCKSSTLTSSCKAVIDDVYVDAVTLLNQMGREGVQNIIYQGYYHVKSGIFGSTSLNPAVDYGDTRLAQAVQNATAVNNYRVFIDPRPNIVNSDIIIDGVHPNDSGSQKLANLIWAKLQPLL
jgi:lysophospholipase L1-like esterase